MDFSYVENKTFMDFEDVFFLIKGHQISIVIFSKKTSEFKKNPPKFLPTSQVMKNFIFASILFALLLTVNAAPFQLNKRAITFGPCNLKPPVDLLEVKIGTDHPEFGKNESFYASGTLTKNDIIKDATILQVAYGDSNGILIADPYFQFFNESIKAGTPFNASASVPTPKLPDSYTIGVIVAFPDLQLTFACAIAAVGVSSEKSKIYDIFKLI
ncbi:hypothetical protein F8M41_021036 [Gigaspora margarita]|uniref:Uncharacterized protein n=1 Tax=Gigaspora margarita TaxID=4874 RepID=A0A8H4B1P3_GIGMA|nr:hypothetical protein F8M41_021036 [Gigaspora margarita]